MIARPAASPARQQAARPRLLTRPTTVQCATPRPAFSSPRSRRTSETVVGCPCRHQPVRCRMLTEVVCSRLNAASAAYHVFTRIQQARTVRSPIVVARPSAVLQGGRGKSMAVEYKPGSAECRYNIRRAASCQRRTHAIKRRAKNHGGASRRCQRRQQGQPPLTTRTQAASTTCAEK